MKLLGDYWRTGHCACNVDVRAGALAVAVVTFVAFALSTGGASVTHGISALIGITTSSLAFYAYYKHLAWAYLPLLMHHGIGSIVNAILALLCAVVFFFSFSSGFEARLKEAGVAYTAEVVRITSAIFLVLFALIAVLSFWFVRILYGAYRWQKMADAQTHQAHPGRVVYDGSVLASGETAAAPLYP
ncbi:hypothetical protein AAVH_32674 [Aphelenchoides avenae]|nr:hypothetical protein AAVH_32674 [Aphelenchus avenae]